MLASYPISVFYAEPRMFYIMLVVAFNYAVNPFGSLTYAWLMREMRFDNVALMRFSAGITGALVSMWLAWKNYGPISLAFGSLTSTLVNAIVAVYFRPKWFPWLPGLREIRRVLIFGSQLTASSIFAVLSSSAPELLLGKLQSLTASGLYSRSSGLVQMFPRLFLDAIGTVCLSWFAQQTREKGNFVAPFLKATAYVTALGWSFCFFIICLAQPIIRLMYGSQWDGAVDLARLLAVAMAFSVPASLCQIALLASGAVSAITRLVILNSLQSIALVALGVYYQGLLGAGIAMIACTALGASLWMRAISKHLDLSLNDLLRTLKKSAEVALLSAVGPALTLWIYGPYPDELLSPLILGGVTGFLGFLAGIFASHHPLQGEVIEIWAKLKKRMSLLLSK